MLTRRGFLPMLAFSTLRAQKSDLFGDAEAYEKFMGRWSRMLAPLLVDFTGIPDNGRVLDIGSGTGALSFAIAEHKKKCRVLGIDPAKEYVAYATSKNRFGDRVRFEIGDAQQLRFENASFDASASLLVFNFIPDPAKSLHEVRRVTKAGGRIAASVWDYGDGMRMLRTFWDAAARIDPNAERLDEKHFALCRAGELSGLWKRGGLAIVEEKPLEIAMRFESFADYWDAFLLGEGPAGKYLQGIPADQKNKLRNEVKRRLPKAGDGAFTLAARAWAVRGTVPKSA